MPNFCRHNRFIERCPICSKDLPGQSAGPARGAGRRGAGGGQAPRSSGAAAARRQGRGHESVRVRREGRAADDGYRCELVPGLRASVDAARLADEIAFASGRLQALAARPPGLYAELAARSEGLERATWGCLLVAYLCPLEQDEPFAGIGAALEGLPGYAAAAAAGADELVESLPLGPRSSHQPGRGAETLRTYGQWVERAGAGHQAEVFAGDPSWAPERRFERLFERLALPGLTRTARYELLVLLGRLGLYELRADTLQLGGRRTGVAEDATISSAKRVFGIGDPMLLERRAQALAGELSVPVESLDLALWNWSSAERATLGFPPEAADEAAGERARVALGLA
jgi:hypothetical protein